MELNVVQQIAIYALPVVFAITLHEAAHGYVARYFGDNTAYMLGRVSLNPLRHIDPIGTILLPLLTLFFGGILFGWAKPVPVNFNQLRNPKKNMLWVALAGPASNLAMALAWALVMKIANMMPDSALSLPMALMGRAGITINAMLMVLNLMPLPPLDGGRIAVSLLPNRLAYRYAMIEPYGIILLVILLFSGVLGSIMWPLIDATMTLISLLFGI
ncbi:MAG: site-2 protease family protein [Betaproteobacteria bacterium]|nr:site-2 protease family protein [Betaproteobacteria bacterium]